MIKSLERQIICSYNVILQVELITSGMLLWVGARVAQWVR